MFTLTYWWSIRPLEFPKGGKTMSELARYDLVLCDGESGRCRAYLTAEDDGEYVVYKEHKTALDRERAEHAKEIADLQRRLNASGIPALQDDNDDLRIAGCEEVERGLKLEQQVAELTRQLEEARRVAAEYMPKAILNEDTTEVHYPAQCSCGHIYLEEYTFSEPREDGAVGFCWCGWCRKKLMVYPFVRSCNKE